MVQYSNLEEDWFVCTFVVLTRLFVMTRAQLYFSTSVDLSKSFHCLNEHFFAPSNLIILPMTLISAWTSHSLDVGGKTVKMWFLHPKTEINIVSLECRLEIRREKICHFRGFKTKAKKRDIYSFFFFPTEEVHATLTHSRGPYISNLPVQQSTAIWPCFRDVISHFYNEDSYCHSP